MRQVLIALVIVSSFIGPAAAADNDDVLAAVKKFVDSFNRGDANAAASCADSPSIIDEIPPYAWAGPGAWLITAWSWPRA